MQPNQDYKQLLTEVVKKQIAILGPTITLAKARSVGGLTIADDGSVTNITGDPQQVTQALIDQFVQLSGLIVRKTMESLMSVTSQPVIQTPTPQVTPIPAAQPQSLPAEQPVQPVPTPVPTNPTPSEPTQINPVSPTSVPTPPIPTPGTPKPATNPLAA